MSRCGSLSCRAAHRCSGVGLGSQPRVWGGREGPRWPCLPAPQTGRAGPRAHRGLRPVLPLRPCPGLCGFKHPITVSLKEKKKKTFGKTTPKTSLCELSYFKCSQEPSPLLRWCGIASCLTEGPSVANPLGSPLWPGSLETLWEQLLLRGFSLMPRGVTAILMGTAGGQQGHTPVWAI